MSFSNWLNKTFPTFFKEPSPDTEVQASVSGPRLRVANSVVVDAAAPSGEAAGPSTVESLLATGKLISGDRGEFPMPPNQRKDFALIRQGDALTLVVATPAYGSGSMLTLRSSMSKSFNQVIELLQATPTQIALFYQQPETVRAVGGAAAGRRQYTAPEALIEDIVLASSEVGTSDIHIESRVESADVYFRVNGLRQIYRNLTHEQAHSMGQVMYSVYAEAASKEVTWDPSEVNDAALEWHTLDGQHYQLRFSSSPIHPNKGFQIVLRVLHLSAEGVPLNKVGYSEEQHEQIEMITCSRSGMVLVCGATNSGKSTSLQAILRNIVRRRGSGIKVITVEDPVEYVVPGVCHIPVSRRKGQSAEDSNSSFNKALRGTLRQDPDVVMVGEVRDKASAGVVKDLVLAGRKLLTTLHTTSAVGAFARLNQIDVPMDILTMPQFISGIIYQSLVPTLCQSCAVSWDEADKSNLPQAFIDRTIRFAPLATVKMKGAGCPNCKGTGIAGRTVCAEVLIPDREFLLLMADKRYLDAEKHWLVSGGMPIIEHAKSKMLLGMVSPVDVEANIHLFPSDDE